MVTIKHTRESIAELEQEREQFKKQRDSLIKDVEQQRELLKDFSRFIHRKVEACPGKAEYIDFRDRLKELGITEREWDDVWVWEVYKTICSNRTV